MNAMNLMATLGLDTKNYESGLKGASGMAQSFASSFKKILGGVAVAGAAGVTVAGAAVTKIVKSSVKAYAEYEQLVGGVETLFGTGGKSLEQYADGASDSMYKLNQRGEEVLALQKELIEAGYDVGEAGADGIYGPKTRAAFDAYAKEGGQLVKDAYNRMAGVSDKVIANADEAYMTAGLSANEYMDTVTSFSASLIQSLGGDTQKAADLSDVAIRDMSDNANKMGTDMSSIQVAYAGFAKQNYTMLDNLKLGYGGTKTEMERLIKDANKLRVAQGKTGDLTISKYSDVIEAIHTVQENMGITGTTAAEAANTIQGSLNSTKAAWQNLLVSFATGKDINKRLDGLVDSAKNVVKNVVPVVTTSLKSIGSFVSGVAPIIAQELPGIITKVGPALLQAMGSLASSIITNFPAMLGALGGAIKQAITGNADASWGEVGAEIWEKIKAGIKVTGDWLKGLVGLTPGDSWGEFGLVIWEKIKGGIRATGDWLKEQLGYTPDDSWSEIGVDLWGKIKDGITATGDWLKEKLGYTPDASWSQIGSDIWGLIKSGISVTGDWLKEQLGYSPSDEWSSIGSDIWEAIKAGLGSSAGRLSEWIGSASDFIGEVNWENVGASLWTAIKTGIGAIGDIFTSLFGTEDEGGENQWLKLGKSISEFVLNGLGAIGETIVGLFSAAWNDIITNETLINIGDKIKEPFEKAVESIKQFFEDIKIKIGEAVEKVSEFLGLDLTAPFASVAAAAEAAFSAVIGWIDSAIEKIQVFLGLKNQASQTDSYDTSVVGDTGPQRAKNDSGGGEVGSGGGRKKVRDAISMNGGTIYKNMTPFGVDQFGAVHYAGGEGAEVVVGANSLTDMIHGAMQDALVGVLSRMDGLLAGQGMGDVKVVLDTGATVGGLVREMDKQMGGLGRWRGGGRA